MADWLIYWADFDAQRARGWPPQPPTEKPFDWWRSSSRRLTEKLARGDRLWLFTSGFLCGYQAAPKAYQTFLPQLLQFDEYDDNPDFNRPHHPLREWKFRLWMQDEGCLAIDPPLLVEDIIFPVPRDFPPARGQTAGEQLQTPRILDAGVVRRLRDRLAAREAELIG